MKRRALLAAASSGVATALAGCVETDPTPGGTGPTPERQTPPADATTTAFNGTPPDELIRREIPEPPDAATPASAREFVRAHERAVLYNDLVKHASGRGEPVQTEVSTIHTDVVADLRTSDDENPRGGLLVVSWGSASTRHGGGGYTIYRSLTVHYITDGVHRTRDYSGYRCLQHALGDDAERDPDDAASLQVYDLTGDDNSHEVSVAVTDRGSNDREFFARYEPLAPGLSIQPGVVASAGRYRVSVARQSGAVADVSWNPQPQTPSWNGLTIVLLPGGRLFAGVLDPDVPASFDGSTCGLDAD